jgi:hypothetical protein
MCALCAGVILHIMPALQVARSRADVLHGDLPAAAAKLREAIDVNTAMGYME